MNAQAVRIVSNRIGCLLLVGSAAAGTSVQAKSWQVYWGMCDASAAIAIDDHRFLMADDELTSLQVYATNHPGGPLQQIPMRLSSRTSSDQEDPKEIDVEGVARRGDRVYWIGSHGRNKKGVLSVDRQRFFAVHVRQRGHEIIVTPAGKVVGDMASWMAADSRLRELGLDAALQLEKKKVKELAPKESGFNIEGLSETRDGTSLLIGLRNPRPRGKALIVPLLNPDPVLDRGARPDFGAPILLDLAITVRGQSHALGIRSLAFSPYHDRYLIVAGPHDSERIFAVFQWSGQPEDAPQLVRTATEAIAQIPDLSPEALVVYPSSELIHVFSDDGGLEVVVASPAECKKGAFKAGRCEAKGLLDNRRKSFRGIAVTLE